MLTDLTLLHFKPSRCDPAPEFKQAQHHITGPEPDEVPFFRTLGSDDVF